ncbi:MAG: small multi-drug export protein [Candidatus Saccharibacteria bacterium]|nr:small multi-drug export protein [Candidatus Saccharibacteria bacterium]
MIWNYLLVFLISMLPIVELRGAIPVGVGMGLDELITYIVALIGNMLPVPLIFLFARKVLVWGKDKKFTKKFFSWCLKKGENLGKKLTSKIGRSTYFALFLFVAIPIPGTGAWTGTLAASILNLDFKKTTIAVLAGVLTAGLIMMAISFGLFNVIFGN